MLDPKVYNSVRCERDLLIAKMSVKNNQLDVVATEIEKYRILAWLYVIAPERSRRKVVIGDGGVAHFAELRDEDRSLCGSFIGKLLEGTHFLCKRGYCHVDFMEYYLQPDWQYWVEYYRMLKIHA